MRKVINILLTLAVIGGSLAGGSYLRRISTNTDTRQEVAEYTTETDSAPLLAKPEFFAYNDLLGARIVEGPDGLKEYKKVPMVWDSTTLRIGAYTSLMLLDNASQGTAALNQADLVDSGILLLREIVSDPDQLYILNSWTVSDSKEVQGLADKYIAMSKIDNYANLNDIKDITNNLYPQWASDRYNQAAAPVYDLSEVKPPSPSSCALPSINREALKIEYENFAPALIAKEYNGSVSLPDSILNVEDVKANMYESVYSKELTNLAFVTAAVVFAYNEQTREDLGYPLMTFKGERNDDKNYQKIMTMLGALHEANIYLNSYSSLGIVGSPLDVYSLETSDPTLEVTVNPSYLSKHALYWTIARGYLKHYGLEFSEAMVPNYLDSPLLEGVGPERFGEGVLYWSAGVDASIALGDCLVKHYLETGV